MTAAPPLHLLLAHADDQQPALPEGLDDEAVQGAAPPARLPEPRNLRNRGRDPNDLQAQRWGLIVPEGEAGERLEALVKPLVDRRREQQGGHEVRIYRVPAQMDPAEAARWHRNVYLDERIPESELPFYQLILGDLDQVPLALQQVQMIDGVVGRIAFPDERDYEAYVDKLLRWERQPAAIPRARSLFFTVHDGSAATRAGYQALVSPALAIAREDRALGAFEAADIVELGDPRRKPGQDELLGAVAAADPAVLLSVSHGQGAPRGGWPSVDEQRRLQGAMSLGGGVLAGPDLASRPFLPGGIWFMFACYGAGTPDTSVYRPWLERLIQLGQHGGRIDTVLRSLPKPGDLPFIARLPQSALANPDGPLAFIGHVDLAWSYSFQELDSSKGPTNRLRRFLSLLSYALRRDRVGVAFRELVSCAIAADTELLALYSRQAALGAELEPAYRARLGHLWMLRQDLMGYILLGDPAARLPITPAPAIEARRLTPGDLFPFASTGNLSPRITPSAEKLEEAILHVLVGDQAVDTIAQEYGIEPTQLKRLATLFLEAGRAAIHHDREP